MEIPNANQSELVEFRIEHDILFCIPNQHDCYLNEFGIETLILTIKNLTKMTPMPLVIDLRKFIGNFDPQAARIFADSSIIKKMILNQAFVTNTLNCKLLVNSYKRIYVNESDIKMFNQMDAAISYCMEIKHKYYA